MNTILMFNMDAFHAIVDEYRDNYLTLPKIDPKARTIGTGPRGYWLGYDVAVDHLSHYYDGSSRVGTTIYASLMRSIKDHPAIRFVQSLEEATENDEFHGIGLIMSGNMPSLSSNVAYVHIKNANLYQTMDNYDHISHLHVEATSYIDYDYDDLPRDTLITFRDRLVRSGNITDVVLEDLNERIDCNLVISGLPNVFSLTSLCDNLPRLDITTTGTVEYLRLDGANINVTGIENIETLTYLDVPSINTSNLRNINDLVHLGIANIDQNIPLENMDRLESIRISDVDQSMLDRVYDLKNLLKISYQ